MTMLKRAKKCKRVQKQEVVDAILQFKRGNPRVTNKEMALRLMCHRNTISKYVNYIRRTYHKSPEELVNLIDNRLEEEINSMHVRDLISLRGQLVPREHYVREEVNVSTKHVEELNVTMQNYETIVQRVVNRHLPEDSSGKQMDTTQPSSEAS